MTLTTSCHKTLRCFLTPHNTFVILCDKQKILYIKMKEKKRNPKLSPIFNFAKKIGKLK
jgi:hypothetical protein